MYSIYILLVTLLGITSVASGYVIGLFMFCFCLSFCKTVRSNTGKFYLLAMIKLYNMLFVGILCILFVGLAMVHTENSQECTNLRP